MPPFFNWPPFKLYAIDADTGKPLDPNVGRKTYTKYYDIKKDGKGKKSLVSRKSANENKAGEKQRQDTGNGETAKEEPKGNAAHADEMGGPAKLRTVQDPWTTEEDEKLKALKAEERTWKQISEALNRSAGACKGRMRELKQDNTTEGQQDDAAAKKSEKSKDKSKGSKDKNSEESGKKSGGSKDNSNHKSKGKGKASSKTGSKADAEAKFTMQEWQTLQEDDLFSFGELQCLSELIAKDSSQSWLRVASAFYDMTGRRINPDDIRDKFRQMGAML